MPWSEGSRVILKKKSSLGQLLSYPVGAKFIDKNEQELAEESRGWLVGTKESRYDGEKPSRKRGKPD